MLILSQFHLNSSNSVGAYKHDDLCKNLDLSTGNSCLCIPPKEIVGPDKEYDCNPAPRKSSNPGVVPVILPAALLADFLDPSEITNLKQTSTLAQLPKRIRGELQAPPDAQVIGWGLHI